jgi:[acyl-carrier-protein] S-malonyltransferase
VMSIALLRVLNKMHPHLTPSVCAGLSLGEYTALTAAGAIDFANCLSLVNHRAQFMNDACEATKGTMAVVMGLDADVVEGIVKEVNMPRDLWAANFNCPGQVVISGSVKGVEAGSAAAKEKGAKRVLPLQVHGAFHSGLMQSAEERLREYIDHAPFRKSSVDVVMNVTGDYVTSLDELRHNLIKQVTHPVRWEQGIRSMAKHGVEMLIEIGCGKTLTAMNKRIGIPAECLSIEKISDLDAL